MIPSSICDTVSPDWSAAPRCLRSTIRDATRAPTTNPMPSARVAATAATRTADATVTRKSYAFGERHPSSVRPFWDMSQIAANVFDRRLPNVCRSALAGHRGNTRGSGVGIEIFATGNHWPQPLVEVVAQRDSGRDVQLHDLVIGHAIEVLHQRPQRVAVRGDQDRLAQAQ